MIMTVAVIWRDGKESYISNPTDFPDVTDTTSKVKEIREPVVKASIIVPQGVHSTPLEIVAC